ncbi:hypothetical protein [Oceanobacillus jeddahense]|uniref:Nudix hydrolase domain-containing protein n=1 Tax=Oceanobacillus jeddahense TaxID=1462527 RepID=A0ABY5JS13_9BACI|nr:hypothetical protein [Oceanobacillus jeddahense]UUI03014.1 hypothetical protein NP439_23785 [Oceanobacillus jeddahense]
MGTVEGIINAIGSEVFSALIGAIVGLVISVIFDDSLRALKKKIKRKYKRMFSVKNEPKSDYFSFGNTKLNFFVVEGDGQSEFSPDNVECKVTNETFALPEELAVLKQEIEEEEDKKKANGLPSKWNGPLYGVARYRQTRTEDMEEMGVVFSFYQTDYFTFAATNLQLDRKLDSGQTIGEKYIPHESLGDVQPFLANGFGIVLVVITADENIILTQRIKSSGARGGEMDVSLVEGVHPSMDKQKSGNKGPNLYETASRGAEEELGFSIDKSDIHFLGYGIDLDFYQWNMIGYARVPETAQQIKDIRSRGASGKWENSSLLFKNFNVENMTELIMNEEMWSTAKVALYWTAIGEFGKKFDKKLSQLSRK